MNSALENIWMQVQKPGRYTGGEVNSTVKDKSNVFIRFALCYPDLYEVGMSNLGIKILYELMNARAGHMVRARVCAGFGYGGAAARGGNSAVWTREQRPHFPVRYCGLQPPV